MTVCLACRLDFHPSTTVEEPLDTAPAGHCSDCGTATTTLYRVAA